MTEFLWHSLKDSIAKTGKPVTAEVGWDGGVDVERGEGREKWRESVGRDGGG